MSPKWNRDAAGQWALRGMVAIAILGFVATLAVRVLRHQWDDHLAETRVWFEQHVGSPDLDSYVRTEIPDEANLGLAYQQLSADPFFSSDEARSVRDVGFRLLGIHVLGAADGEATPLSEADFTAARNTLDRQSALLGRLDHFATLSESRLERLDPSNTSWPLAALNPARVRSTEVALLIHDGRCAEAGIKALALERMAAALNGEAHLLYKIVGLSLEKGFYRAVQKLAEIELAGECTTVADWLPLRRAIDHQTATSAPFATVIAAEGAQVRGAVRQAWENAELSLLDRALGRNVYGWESLSLAAYGTWAMELGRAPGPSAPIVPLPARWLAQDSVAQMLIPNLREIAVKADAAVTSRRLATYAINLARCARLDTCELHSVALPQSYPDKREPSITIVETEAVISFLPAEADWYTQARTHGSHTLRVPAELVAAP